MGGSSPRPETVEADADDVDSHRFSLAALKQNECLQTIYDSSKQLSEAISHISQSHQPGTTTSSSNSNGEEQHAGGGGGGGGGLIDYQSLSQRELLAINSSSENIACALRNLSDLRHEYETAARRERAFLGQSRAAARVRSGSRTARDRGHGGDASSNSLVCRRCYRRGSPQWRRGPMGPQTLCNVCGLVYAKQLKRQAVVDGGKTADKDEMS